MYIFDEKNFVIELKFGVKLDLGLKKLILGQKKILRLRF